MDIASADFQNVWPTPKAARNTIHRGAAHASRVILPVVPEQNPRLPEPDLKPSPNPLPAISVVPKPEYNVTFDLIRQTATLFTKSPSETISFVVSSEHPAEATMTAVHTMFRHLVELEVTVNGKRHFNKSWSVVVPREMN